MIRNTDRGTLTEGDTFEFIDGQTGQVTVPANIREDRPLRVWVVKPTDVSGWVVAGEIRSL